MALFGRLKKFDPYFETTAIEPGGYEFDEDLDDLEEGELPGGDPYYVGGAAKFRDAATMLDLLKKAGIVHVTETVAPDGSTFLFQGDGQGLAFGRQLSINHPLLRGRGYGFFGKRTPDLTDLDVVREDCDYTIEIQVWGRASGDAEVGALPCGIERAKVGENREAGILMGGDNWALWVTSTKGLRDSFAFLADDISKALGQGITFWDRYGTAPFLVPEFLPEIAYDVFKAGNHPQYLTAIVEGSGHRNPDHLLPDISNSILERQLCVLFFAWRSSGYVYGDIPVIVTFVPSDTRPIGNPPAEITEYAKAVRAADPQSFVLVNKFSRFVIHLHPSQPGEAEMSRIAVDYFQTQLSGDIYAPVLKNSTAPVKPASVPRVGEELLTPSAPFNLPGDDD